MPQPSRSEATRLLKGLSVEGTGSREKAAAVEELLALAYDELRRVASRIMARERAGHTLQPTALVHEAYLKLVDQTSLRWNDRAHFLGIAARAMRQILVDHARRSGAVKRGGEMTRVTLDESVAPDVSPGASSDLDLLDLNQALERLAVEDDRAARVAELRLFGGLSVKEAAHVLGVSVRTVGGDWAMARLWLSREISGTGE